LGKKTLEQSSRKHKVILSVGAHNDDYIIGMAGTTVKYINEGYRIINLICSYGELGLPHIKEEITREIRVKESLNADSVLGGKDIIYLGMREGKFPEEFPKHEQFIKKLIEKYKPEKIFTHSMDDPHPDHKAVHREMIRLYDNLSHKPEIYTFDVWNVINIKKRNIPKLVVDISPYFKKKVQSFRAHKSQQLVLIIHLWSLYVKAILNGLHYGYKFAEVFYRVK
jgi:LmbE family N-acetylglucosaminyl deacetylase